MYLPRKIYAMTSSSCAKNYKCISWFRGVKVGRVSEFVLSFIIFEEAFFDFCFFREYYAFCRHLYLLRNGNLSVVFHYFRKKRVLSPFIIQGKGNYLTNGNLSVVVFLERIWGWSSFIFRRFFCRLLFFGENEVSVVFIILGIGSNMSSFL